MFQGCVLKCHPDCDTLVLVTPGAPRGSQQLPPSCPPEENPDLISVCLKGGISQDGSQALLSEPWDEQELEERNPHLNMKKNFFTVMVTEWNRLP